MRVMGIDVAEATSIPDNELAGPRNARVSFCCGGTVRYAGVSECVRFRLIWLLSSPYAERTTMRKPPAGLRLMKSGVPAAKSAGPGLAARAGAVFAPAGELLHWAEVHAACGQESDR